VKNEALDAAITASFPARDGLRATWAYRSLVARNLVMQFVEESTDHSSALMKETA
jgi:xanthine dehydrogenase small subunit